MNNRNRLIAFAAGGIFVLLILATLVQHRIAAPTTTWNSAVPIPQVLTVSAPFGTDGLVASNGRSFITYNYRTGAATALSDDNNNSDLEGIDQIYTSPDQKYILFHMPAAQVGSIFATQLNQQGLDTTQPYWWIYDIAAKAYHNFPQNAQSVKFANGNVYALSTQGAANIITSYSLPNLQQLIALPVPGVDEFYPIHDGYLLGTSEQSNILETKDGVVNTQIFSNASVLNITSDGETALISKAVGSQAQIETYNIQTKKETVVATDVIVGNGTWTAQNSIVYSRSQNNAKPTYYLYDSGKNKTVQLQFTNSVFKTAAATPTTLLSTIAGIATAGNNGSSYIVGNNLHSLKAFDTSYNKQVQTDGNIVTLQYYPDESAFIVTLDSSDAANEKKAVYTQLRSDGYDPMLLDIRFTVFTPLPINGR